MSESEKLLANIMASVIMILTISLGHIRHLLTVNLACTLGGDL